MLLGFPTLGGQVGEWRSPQNVRQEAKWRGSSLNCPIPATGAPFSSSGFGTRGMSPWCCWQSVSFPSEAPAQAMLPWHCCEAHMVWYIPTRASLLAEGWTSVGGVQASSQLNPRELGDGKPNLEHLGWKPIPPPFPTKPLSFAGTRPPPAHLCSLPGMIRSSLFIPGGKLSK